MSGGEAIDSLFEDSMRRGLNKESKNYLSR